MRLSFTGVEVAVRLALSGANQELFAYTALHGAQQALNGLLSRYLFNYPVNNASMQWLSRLPREDSVAHAGGSRRALQQRSLCFVGPGAEQEFQHVRPFLQLSNLANTSYQEIAGVAMPGSTILGGVGGGAEQESRSGIRVPGGFNPPASYTTSFGTIQLSLANCASPKCSGSNCGMQD